MTGKDARVSIESGRALVQESVTETVAVHGLGYIGLPTSLAFAQAGLNVVGVDVNLETIALLQAGQVHLFEDGLDAYYADALTTGRFRATDTAPQADVHLIAVPTPVDASARADLSYVEAASGSIAKVLQRGDLVVLESTVPPRTTVEVVGATIQRISGLRHGVDYDLAHCPERVIPGRILIELFENDRIIGGTTAKAAARAAELYRSFVRGAIFETDATTAEAVKLMENTFRDVNIALANEMRAVCERIGADPVEAIRLANRHPRVNIHQPGIGVGGHCIPVDPWFLVQSAPDLAVLIRTAREINDRRPATVAEDLLERLRTAGARSVALLGLAYKPDVDDFRESPAVSIAERVAAGFEGDIRIVEPFASALPPSLEGCAHARLVSLAEALAGVDGVACLVGHSAFAEQDAKIACASLGAVDYAGLWT